jgi:hypothetical protein
MSKKTKKPAEQTATKVKNINLLPQVFATEPNKKMLDATLDVMSSKGQMLPFRETHGLRSASNKVEEFFVDEADEVRRESQANTALIFQDSNSDFSGKASYLDIDNYFNLKNMPLLDGTVLDKNINVLDLPVNPYKITDYGLFYWLAAGLPACKIHLEPKEDNTSKFSVIDDIIGKPYVTIVDDATGRSLELQTGMVIYFTGKLDDTDYLTVNEDNPVTFFVHGVGDYIELTKTTAVDKRIPNSYLKKRPWDKDAVYIDPPAIKWDSEVWDGSELISSQPEYVTQERANVNHNPWQVIDRWYHITTIRTVAQFLRIKVSEIANATNKAKRPIITFYKSIKLFNWPNNIRAEVAAILPYNKTKYQGLTIIKDSVGFSLSNNDLVVFEDDAGVYRVNNLATGATFTLVLTAAEKDGALITAESTLQYHRLIYKNSSWQFAQNKTEPNQTPLFDFYNSDKVSLETLNESNFTGGVILGFKEGNTLDLVLQKYIEVSSIDFDLINEANSSAVSPNQLKFHTEVDSAWEYTDSLTGQAKNIVGPYGFAIGSNVFSFYQQRRGLDITKQVQDLIYKTGQDEIWSAPIEPFASAMEVIHVYYDQTERWQFYTEVGNYGLVKFSSKKSFNTIESLLPLIAGKKIQIVCHNLPQPFVLYKTEIIDNITTAILLEEPYCFNNSITDGVIDLDLTDSISLDGGISFIENELVADERVLQFSFTMSGSKPLLKTAPVKPEYKWRFLQNLHFKDKTNPIFNGYDYLIDDYILPDGTFSYYQAVRATPLLVTKIADGDKVLVDGVINNPVQKTAPLSLTLNPLNQALTTLNYFSLYQHATSIKSNATNSKEYVDFESLLQSAQLSTGTFVKHSSPISKLSVLATSMPFDFTELLIKQGKHYDIFLTKLKTELANVIDNNNYEQLSSYELLSLVLEKIFVNDIKKDGFWSHSNMLGWGEQLDNYRETSFVVDLATRTFALSGEFETISHRAGKELLTQITADNKFLVRGVDYTFNSSDDNYVSLTFAGTVIGKTVNIKQWYSRFKSQVPASLAKLGLVPPYRPEIYQDNSFASPAYFLIRHDGSKLFLEQGVDNDNYPNNLVERLLYEYELAVWANLSYDVRNNDFKEIIESIPGYFRTKERTYKEAIQPHTDEAHSWLVENNIYDIANSNYDANDAFTWLYQLGSGDDESTLVGSWRLIYKFIFDTDRPHTHPWEMLGYTVKPYWWDTYYSWTDSAKRTALELALRTGKFSNPSQASQVNPKFARCNSAGIDQFFPVDTLGNLLAPNDSSMSWSNVNALNETWTWDLGTFGPYEQVFASTQRGVAATAKAMFLNAPILYTNRNWVPGQQVRNSWEQYVDRTSGIWQQGAIEHDYHRSEVDGQIVYTSGIESLYAEFCILNNKDFVSEVVDKFNNVKVNKEFLLQGFSNKDNVKIQSTSINSQRQTLFIPEESYAVRTVKHYPHKEVFYSAMRIVFDGTRYSVFGFCKENTKFNIFLPTVGSSTMSINVGGTVIKQKVKYDSTAISLDYGTSFTNRVDLFDYIIGYGKYLESLGFKFDTPEGGDIRNWQLSAKQFIFWSNDQLAPGNYIDLNPAADSIEYANTFGQLENLEGTNLNPGLCVDRFNRPLFSKDLLVNRNNDGFVSISTKDTARAIYGIKMTFASYETVVHLDSVSVFNDIYFLPEQSTSKRSFVFGGKKTQNWTGEYFAPGYVFASGNKGLIPNLDTMSEQGRNLLDVESVLIDPTVADAIKDQFGLSRNVELKQLFLQESNEVLFKNAITYTKGTNQVFSGLEPLTHTDESSTRPYEEYMVRLGEFGNTKNIDYFEFELLSEDLKRDSQVAQVIKFIGSAEPETESKILYIKDNSPRWVYKPLNKQLRFNTLENSYSLLKSGGPVLDGDFNFKVDRLETLPTLFNEFAPLAIIEHYDATASYKKFDQVRYDGKLYYARTTVSPNTWANNNDKFTQIDEPFLPNIYVNNYYKTNPDLSSSGSSIFTPGTWQLLQTVDRSIGVVETCPGPNDTSRARISTNKPHGLQKGDYVVIVNVIKDATSVDGLWQVIEVEGTDKFYVNTRITCVIGTGKIFPLKPVRFKNSEDFALATDDRGYAWKKKVNPFENAIDGTVADYPLTTSGYSSIYPIAIIDDGLNSSNAEASFDFGNFKVYSVNGGTSSLVKEESQLVDVSDVEHLVIYDYSSNKTLATLELFDPKKLLIPEVFKNDIDVIGRVDPARYNRTSDEFKSVYTSLSWYEEMVGRRWWDTSTVNFADYETGSDLLKAKHWGSNLSTAPADVYEWTKSPVHPNQWKKLVENKTEVFGQVATGEAYVDRSLNKDNYHWVEEQDYTNGNAYTVYYFWVKNKKTIAKESSNRIYTTHQLAAYVLNPSAAGLAWWSPIGYDSIMLKGVNRYLNNSSTVVQIKKKSKGNEKHQQWTFIAEGHETETIPEWIHIRFRDSISAHVYYRTIGNYTSFSGTEIYKQSNIVKFNDEFYVCRINMFAPAGTMDIYSEDNLNGAWFKLTNVFELPGSLIGTWDGYFWDNIPHDYSLDKFWFWKTKNVPDQINLHRYSRLGNGIRPYLQSWFADTLEARRTFIKQLNETMTHVDISSVANWGNTRLNNTEFKIADEQVDITQYWSYVDFRAETFNATKAISLVLDSESDIYTVSTASGDYVKVNTGIRDYVIYEKNSDQSFSVVYRTNGAIEFDAILYDPVGLSSWDTVGNDVYPWDFDLNAVFNAIVDALRYEILIGNYVKYYSTLICVMFRYVLAEQVNVDWLTKSSTIEPVNLIGQSLTNDDTLKRDKISVLTNFYTSVKSYRDKIRGGSVSKTVSEDVALETTETLKITEFEAGIEVDSYFRI